MPPSAQDRETTTTILITGAAGWLGGLLANALLRDSRTINTRLILVDIVEPKPPVGLGSKAGNEDAKTELGTTVITFRANLCDSAQLDELFKTEFGVPDVVYCMHGIMSRGSEDDFDGALKVNVDSVRALLDATRRFGVTGKNPSKFIFTSSLAVYGGPLPDVILPSTATTPEGAYGMGKLVGELFVNEYTRRGYIDGRILRLPTITVRPGAPSAATSAFISGIIREPLLGKPTTCPIGSSPTSPALNLPIWIASPSTTITNLVTASHIPSSHFTPHTRVVCLPGFTTTIREEIDALREVGGEEAVRLIRFEEDEVNRRVVGSWPARFDNTYAMRLGFVVDEGGILEVVREFKRGVDEGLW